MTTHCKPHWHLSEFLTALGLPSLAIDVPISGVSIDTRTLKPGDIYIPMHGERDGHNFVSHAFTKGAAAAIVATTFDTSTVNGICISVPDTLVALQQLGVYNRSLSCAKVIAVTGSVGKTTTKEMLGHILTNFGKTVISRASYNNCWGVPLSLLELRPDTEFGVFEVGMNNPGEIEPLAHMIAPDIAIITKIVEAHIGHMGTIEAIAVEKITLIKALRPGGTALIYGGGPCEQLLNGQSVNHNHMLFDIESIKANVLNGITHIDTHINGKVVRYTLPFSGMHHVGNSILALQACHLLGIDGVKAAKTMETFTLPAGRGITHVLALTNGISITLIDDAYNANPSSMRAGLLALKAIKKTGRHFAVLGEMRELGTDSAMYHRELLSAIVDADIDQVFCCCEAMQHLYDVLPESIRGAYTDTSDELITYVIAALQSGDLVFVKGSNGSKISHIVNALIACESGAVA